MTTDRQKKLLAAEDWRLHAVGPVGTGLGMLATSEKHEKKIVNFALPSAPALFLGLARDAHVRRQQLKYSNLFDRNEQGIWPENHTNLFNYFQDFALEVIFSHTALESFANEVLPVDAMYSFKRSKTNTTFEFVREEIERQVSLDEKLSQVLPKLFGLKSPKGLKPWEEYKNLKHFRDRLVHLKSTDRKASGPENQTIWGAMLEKRNLVFPDIAHGIMGHFSSLTENRRWFQNYISPTADSN